MSKIKVSDQSDINHKETESKPFFYPNFGKTFYSKISKIFNFQYFLKNFFKKCLRICARTILKLNMSPTINPPPLGSALGGPRAKRTVWD